MAPCPRSSFTCKPSRRRTLSNRPLGHWIYRVLGARVKPPADQTIDKNNVAVVARFRYEDRADLDRLNSPRIQ